MQTQIELSKKTADVLLSELHSYRNREKETVAILLKYLCEVVRRSLYLKRGFDSMYSFCLTELGYSKDEAYLRIQAMRVLRDVPETEEKLKKGSLSLSAMAKAQAAFRKENQRRKEENVLPLSREEKAQTLQVLASQSSRDVQKELAVRFPLIQEDIERTKPICENRTLIQFAASDELMNRFGELKALLAHKNFDGRWEEFFSEISEIALKKLETKTKAKPEVEKNSQQQQNAPATFGAQRKPYRKYISVHVKREVYRLAGNQCEYIDRATGRRCCSQYGLQIDHVMPLALGGSDEIANMRLLCSRHNQYLASKMT